MELDPVSKATELLYKGKAEFDSRDFVAAEETLSIATDLLETNFGPDHLQKDEARVLLVDTRELLADTYFGEQKFDLCAQNYRWLLDNSSFRDTITKLRLRYKLAKTFEQQYKKSEALALYEEAADLCERKIPDGTLVAALALEAYYKLLKEDRRSGTFVTMIAEKARRARGAVVPAPEDGALSIFGRTLVTQEVQVLKSQIDAIKNIPEAPIKTSPLKSIVRIALSVIIVAGGVFWLSRLNTNLALVPVGGSAATLNGQTFRCPGLDGSISFGEAGEVTVTLENQQHKLHSRNAGGLSDVLQTLIHGNANEWWICPQDQYFFDTDGQIFYSTKAPDLLLYTGMSQVSDRVTKEEQVAELTYENPFSHEQSKLDTQAQRTPMEFIDTDEKLLRISGVSQQPLPLSIALYGYSDPPELLYNTGKDFDGDFADLCSSFPADKERLNDLKAMNLKKVVTIVKAPTTAKVHHVPGSIAFGAEDTTVAYGADGKQLPYFIVRGVKEWKWHGPVKRLRYNDPASSADFIVMQSAGSVPNVLPDKQEIVISNWTRGQITNASARRRWTPVWFYLSIATFFMYFLLAYKTNDLFNHGLFSTLVLACGCASSLCVQPFEQYFLYGAFASALLWIVAWFRKSNAVV